MKHFHVGNLIDGDLYGRWINLPGDIMCIALMPDFQGYVIDDLYKLGSFYLKNGLYKGMDLVSFLRKALSNES